MAAPTLNSKSLGNVETISWTKDAHIVPLPFPGADSDSTETFDLLGVTKIITVVGVFTGANVAAVKSQVDNISSEVDGEQDSSVVFSSDETGNLNVKVASFDVTWEIPSNRAKYTLKLIEGV
jgi:hypothetical protein